MNIKKDNIIIDKTLCAVYTTDKPKYLLIQPVDEHDLEALDNQVELITSKTSLPFILVAFKINNWNKDLSPWIAPAVFGKEDFGNNANETLLFIENTLIKEVYTRYELETDIPKILGGYSLAALFSLWAGYQADVFTAIMAASPSVWFPNWINYIENHHPKTTTIYLSLGNKEEKTKNPIMATVSDCIQKQHQILLNHNIKTTLKWNEGNHFKDSDKRCAKGFIWCINMLERSLQNQG